MDACVDGDTLVITSDGPIRIADLVGQSGTVLSRSGCWARFCGARKTIENTPTVRLQFSDGSEVVCTPDHPFLTPQGWKKAVDMAGASNYNGVSQSNHRLSVWAFLSSLRTKSRYFRDAATISAGSISSGMASDYTGWFGSCGMRVISLAASTSTTRTTTGPTITPAILSWYPDSNILASTKKGTSESLTLQSQPLPSGTQAPKGSNGTSSITRSLKAVCTRFATLCANTAACRSKPNTQGPTDSARTTARPSRAEYLAWMIRNVCAWFVASISWRISTARHRRARENALVQCLAISDAGNRDVYCLTVPGTSSFCIASGQVVHNTRYFVMSGRDRMKTAPAPKPTSEFPGAVIGGYGGGWMA